MLLTISTTYQPATDLGFLLHKNPAASQSFELSFGKAHVFYPEATSQRCTVALLLDVDPIDLVRGRRDSSGEGATLQQYVNDRPYAASSFMSVAISRIFGSALKGKTKERPELAETPIPLEVEIAVLPCKGGEDLLRRLFEPLGYAVTAIPHILDEKFPEWGPSPYFTVRLRGTLRLRELLNHLHVLIPVLDDEKHYWVADDEVDKLLRLGEGWLAAHPEKETIAHRYLKHQRSLTEDAIFRLMGDEDPAPDEVEKQHANEEVALEKSISLNEQRLTAVLGVLKKSESRRVIDLGCGEGRLLRGMYDDQFFREIVGMDVSHRALDIAHKRLRFDEMPAMQKERIKLIQGSLTYRDQRLVGFEAATVIEVIEHLDAARLSAFERVLFEVAKPKVVVMTTPNVEFNSKFGALRTGSFRHKDHRFEWTRKQFQDWANEIGRRFGYTAEFLPIGPEDPVLGPPTQLGLFARI